MAIVMCSFFLTVYIYLFLYMLMSIIGGRARQ